MLLVDLDLIEVWLHPLQMILVSSANSLTDDSTSAGKSFILSNNSVGDSKAP